MKSNLRKIVFTATLLSLAIVVDLLVAVIPGLNLELPFGGKIFNLGLLPLILIGLFFGIKFGIVGGLLFAFFKFSMDYIIFISTLKDVLESWTGTSWTAFHIIGLVMFDYIIPFGAFGLSGIFSKLKLSSNKNILLMILYVSSIWLLSGTLSGVLLWGSSIKWAANEGTVNIATNIFRFVNNNLFLYSLIYNSIYVISTSIIIFLILSISKKQLTIVLENSVNINN